MQLTLDNKYIIYFIVIFQERESSLIKLRNEVCVFWGYQGISMINWSMEDEIAAAKFMLHKK